MSERVEAEPFELGDCGIVNIRENGEGEENTGGLGLNMTIMSHPYVVGTVPTIFGFNGQIPPNRNPY